MQRDPESLSISERIRLTLMDDISTGALAPGTVLEESTLAETFNASRTPIRDALRQLEAAGLVEIRPRRGAVVLPMTLPHLLDMFEVAAEMEVICVRFATHRMTGLERAELVRLHELSEGPAAAGDFAQYDSLNLAFHETIYRGTHNQFLVDQALQLRVRLLPFRRTQLRQGDRVSDSRHEHGALLRAMARGDADEATLVMREHMINAGTALAQYLASEPVDSPAYSDFPRRARR